MDMSFEAPTASQKRKERSSVLLDTPSPQGQTPKRQKLALTTHQKLDKLFDLLKEMEWTLGETLHHLFAHRDSENYPIPRSQRQGLIVEVYLSGRSTYTVSGILEAWLTSPYGRGHSNQLMFDTETPYLTILPVRHALSAFAAQTCAESLQHDSSDAVKKTAGLWAINGLTLEPPFNKQIALRENQCLAMHFMRIIAEPEPRSRKGVLTVRKSRPREHVVTSCLASLTFCKNDQARLLPLARGILYLSSNVPMDIISYGSRIANMPAVNTIKAALKGFSDQKAVAIRTRGRDVSVVTDSNGRRTTMAKKLIFDNVQHFRRQRELRVGRENSMIIGIAATFIEFRVDLEALDPLDKRHRIVNSRRPYLTVDELLGMIDQTHIKNIGILQFLEALTNYIPEAAIYKKDLYIRYRTRVAKLNAPVEKTPISPLATSGKNEAYLAELLAAFLDFLEQIGQTDGNFDMRLWFGGGDGMSYNNMLLLKRYLQNHKDTFQSFELLRPVLQLWHTMWTDLCRIFETHWGDPLNDNPATLGHSAKKIGRAPPSNLKKVDYYPSAQLLNVVHDMRMLDCWRIHLNTTDIFAYFTERSQLKTLPSFEELEIAAKKLFETYVSAGARYQVQIDARDEAASWATQAPVGAPWQRPAASTTAAAKKGRRKPVKLAKLGAKTAKKPLKKKTEEPPKLLEVAAAVAQGAVGRVWEALKVMVFTFGGSSHTKYMGYLLEMICDLELESNPYLKDANFLSMVLNPDGSAGGFKAGDIFQEFLNRCIDPIVQRKDADYGANHVRNIWSRNIKDIYDLKNDFRTGLGLEKRSGRHKKPHERPEVKILLREYQATELNKCRLGRTFDDGRNVDNFQAGIQALAGGALQKWTKRTTNARIHLFQHKPPAPDAQPENSDRESDWSDEEEEDTNHSPMTPGDINCRDGEVIIDMGEASEEDILTGLQELAGLRDGDSSDNDED
ncbi:hypothetical protein B0H10DRAFT_2233056 [Mycena sp. CBHHK59/15]|nr:hypothetical protein B0H10DRAFT_2233056 [Mycena sp. CBHHK59/15]